jgi:3-hydroxyisobutyrate dehydrogenase-like beta-hydroxyacid dehydrogenase
VETAQQVGAARFTGLYIEANPLSPKSLQDAQAALPDATFIDAGVIGPPPKGGPTPTHLMLSGSAAQRAADLWAGTAVTPMVVGEAVGAASAAKSSYALYNKGKSALAVLAFQLAAKHGVTDALTAQQVRADAGSLKDPGLPEQLTAVAWRWGPEFDELAETLDAAGLEGDAARALREVWTRLSR